MNLAVRWIVGLLGIGIFVGGLFYLTHPSQPPNTAAGGSVPLAATIQSIDLSPALNQTGTGIATRQYIDGIFVHGITAELPDPPTGQTYGGWLVMNGDTAHALFTGTLMKQGTSYSLDYSSPLDQRSYTEVRVTAQTGASQAMQTMVMSGTFSQ